MKIFFRAIFIATLISNILSINLYAQINLPSPEVQSMLKFGQNDVSLYSGGVDIGVNIFTIESFVNIPIKLSYNGSHGILVRENASRVGLGWSLSPGLVVTKVVKGQHDNSQYGFAQIGQYFDFENSTSGDERYSYDYEPDLHYYSTLKSTGSFYSDKKNNIIKIPLSDVDLRGGFLESIGSFTITETDGTQYLYSDSESAIVNMKSGSNSGDGPNLSTSCNISKILSANKKDTVLFEYIDGIEKSYNYDNNGEPVFIDAERTTLGYPKSYSTNYTKILKTIKWKNGIVEFKYKKEGRKDLEGGSCIERIIVKNKLGDIIKSCEFVYSYFSDRGVITYEAGQSYPYETEDKGSRLRLKLDKAIIHDKSNTHEEAYSFEYENRYFLPERSSKSLDHWGYYNGANNATLCPIANLNPNGSNNGVSAVNRDSQLGYSKAGVLNKIIYPTGGITEFNFEPNSLNRNNYPDSQIGVKVVEESETTVEKVIHSGDETSLDYIEGTRVINNLDCTKGVDRNKENTTFLYVSASFPPKSGAILIAFKNLETEYIKEMGYSFNNSNNNILKVKVPRGKYSIKAWSTANQNDIIYRWDITVMWLESILVDSDENHNFYVGGLRIKSITNKIGNLIVSERNFDYTDNGYSTGYITQEPEYVYMYFNGLSFGQPMFYANNSIFPLRLTQGSVVGYSKVTEYIKDNGKTESFFYTAKEHSDFANAFYKTPPYYLNDYVNGFGVIPYFPLPEKQSNDLIRGKLKFQKIFKEIKKEDETKYNIIKEIINTFKYENPSLKQNVNGEFLISNIRFFKNQEQRIKGQKIIRKYNNSGGDNTGIIHGVDYFITSGIVINESTITKNYSDNGVVESIVKYTYNDNAQIEKTENILDSNKQETEYYYPNCNFLKNLYDRNIIESPYLQISKNNGKVISASQNEYRTYNNDPVLLMLSKVKQGHTTHLNNDIIYDDNISFDKYDAIGNLLQITQKSGVFISYLYSYNNTLPIAKIENATYQGVENILGKEVISELGLSHDDSYIKSKTSLLREALPNAQLTSYTHKPLVGVTSITDPNGVTTYYEYDDFGRLNYVLDADKNVISSNSYQYQGQTVTEDSHNFMSITATATGGGTISPSGAVMVPLNGSKTFTVTPAATTKVKRILVNGEVVVDNTVTGGLNPKPFSNTDSKSYTLNNILANTIVTAEFEPRKYAIIVGKSGISELQNVQPFVSYADHGSSRTFTFTEEVVYEFIDVKVNGLSVGKKYSHIELNITKDISVVAEYRVCDPNSLTIFPAKFFIDGSGGSSSFDIMTCGNWTVTRTTPGTWLTIDKTSGSGNSTITVIAPSLRIGSRTATLEVKAGTTTKLVTINQIADDGGLLKPDPRIVLEPDPRTVLDPRMPLK